MSEAVKIGSYTLRPATERDRDLIAIWIEGDPDHRDWATPDFFLGKRPEDGEAAAGIPGRECFAVEDARGNTVFYVLMTRALRLHVQFGPDETTAQRERNADALREGFGWLERGAAGSGIWEILFSSTNDPLITFAKRRLRFNSSPNELRHKVAGLPAYKPREKPLRQTQ